MGKLLNATDLCVQALRLVGKLPTSESAAEGEDLQVALVWLDMIMEELNGTSYVFSFVPQTIFVPLIAGQAVYPVPVSDTLGGMQFPLTAYTEDNGGNRSELFIVNRETFESVNRSAQVGVPGWIHIDRLPTPTLRTFPVLGDYNDLAYRIGLIVQAAPPDVTPKGVANSQPTSSRHGFRAAWQRFLIFRLAMDLGSGPIATLPGNRLSAFERQAAISYARLDAFDRERDNEPPIAEAYEPGYDTGRYIDDYSRRLR